MNINTRLKSKVKVIYMNTFKIIITPLKTFKFKFQKLYKNNKMNNN